MWRGLVWISLTDSFVNIASFKRTLPFNNNVLVLLQASHFVARWKSWRGKFLRRKQAERLSSVEDLFARWSATRRQMEKELLSTTLKSWVYSMKNGTFSFLCFKQEYLGFSLCIRSRSDHFLALSKPYGLCWDLKDLTLGFRYTCSILELNVFVMCLFVRVVN